LENHRGAPCELSRPLAMIAPPFMDRLEVGVCVIAVGVGAALTGGATDVINYISKRRLEAHRTLLRGGARRGCHPICPARIAVRGDGNLGATIRCLLSVTNLANCSLGLRPQSRLSSFFTSCYGRFSSPRC